MGCDNCYAETLNHRWGSDNWGKGKPRRVTSDVNWRQPIAWNKSAQAAGRIDKVFCASLADVMDDEAPEGARERLWELIDKTPNLIWQLLTKRPHRYGKYLPATFKHDNVWLGSSAENQHYYDIRWPILCEIGVVYGLTTFISYEPALGSLTLRNHPAQPDWIIMGGESGNKRRPMSTEWMADLKTECEEYGVSLWTKQMSARTPEEGADLIPAELLTRKFPA
jgi:protein gp37